MCAGSGLFFRLVAPDEQGRLAAEVLQVGHSRRRELQGPAAAGTKQLYGAVIDFQLPVLTAAGAGDAPPLADIPQLAQDLFHDEIIKECPLGPGLGL